MNKPNKHLQTVYEEYISKHRTTTIYQNIKENIYFSEGYPNGINWEYHPDKSNLRIYYPFPTFEELKLNGVKHYADFSPDIDWVRDIEPRLANFWFCLLHGLKRVKKYQSYDIGELPIRRRLHQSITDFFIFELTHREDEDIPGLTGYMTGWDFNAEEILNANLKIKALSTDLEIEEDVDDDNIKLCTWRVQKMINDYGYQDVEVSIQLTEFHNEYCKVLCTKKHDFGIHGHFGGFNGIDYFRDDSLPWGVYVNLNIDHMYDADSTALPIHWKHFPWNRLN